MKKFKNVSGKNLFVRGFGLVKAGATILAKNLNKKKFEEVKEEVKVEKKKTFKK